MATVVCGKCNARIKLPANWDKPAARCPQCHETIFVSQPADGQAESFLQAVSDARPSPQAKFEIEPFESDQKTSKRADPPLTVSVASRYPIMRMLVYLHFFAAIASFVFGIVIFMNGLASDSGAAWELSKQKALALIVVAPIVFATAGESILIFIDTEENTRKATAYLEIIARRMQADGQH